MAVKVIILIALALIVISLLIYLIGIFLPAERIVSKKGYFNTTPQVLYNTVTNNNRWEYRSNLKDLIIISSDKDTEVWDEISEDGSSIRFRTKEKRPYSYYSFDMDSKMFSGYWTGEFEPAGEGKTLFTATEYIKVRNPFIKTLSYIFFDIDKFMETYQDDLRRKIEEQ